MVCPDVEPKTSAIGWARVTTGALARLRYVLALSSICTILVHVDRDEEQMHSSSFLFNPELKSVIGISTSLKLQIWYFFFLNFSKITFFHFMVFICMLITIIIIFTCDLFSSTLVENRKICFCRTICNVTSYFIILWWK